MPFAIKACPFLVADTASPVTILSECWRLTVLRRILILGIAVRRTVLMPGIDVIGKRHINAGKSQ